MLFFMSFIPVAINFTLNQNWDQEYANKTSDKYKTLKTDVENKIVSQSLFLRTYTNILH